MEKIDGIKQSIIRKTMPNHLDLECESFFLFFFLSNVDVEVQRMISDEGKRRDRHENRHPDFHFFFLIRIQMNMDT